MKKFCVILLFIGVVMVGTGNRLFAENPSPNYIIGYVFVKDNLLDPDTIATKKLTHINYAFADIKNGEVVQGFKNDHNNFKILNSLKKDNPQLKVLISVGGWTWSGNFSDMALTPESRKKFIESGIKFMLTHQLDGIDLDWEFPGLVGYGNTHRPEDKENFTALVKEMKLRMDEVGKKNNRKHLFTIAAAAFDDYLRNTEMGKVQKHLDFINIMAYDLYESEADSITGHHTPLFTNDQDKKKVSADAAIRKFMQAGVPAQKLVLGMAFYGRAWGEVNPSGNGLFQPGKPVKIGTSFKHITTRLLKEGEFKRYWDPQSKAPYLWSKERRIFISYDDEQSIAEKCKYILKNKLKGAMFWQYYSDFEGRLLNRIYRHLK